MTPEPDRLSRTPAASQMLAIGARDGWWCFYCERSLVRLDRPLEESCEWQPEYRSTEHCGCGLHGPGEECVREAAWAARRGFEWPQRDHATPRSRGGGNELDNLVLACCSCNAQKGPKTMEEYLEWLERTATATP